MSRIHTVLPTLTLSTAGGATADSASFKPAPGHSMVVAYIKTTTSSATVTLQRQDAAGNWNALETGVAHVSGTEQAHTITKPVAGPIRAHFASISVGDGTAQIEFMDDAP